MKKNISRLGQPICKYADYKAPYSLYFGLHGENPEWTDTQIDAIAETFCAVYGGNIKIDTHKIRELNPFFQAIHYVGGWSVKATDIIANDRFDLAHYHLGDLSENMLDLDTRVKIFNTKHPLIHIHELKRQFPSQPLWVIVNGELMDVVDVSSDEMSVKRTANIKKHALGSKVLFPILGRNPLRSSELFFRHDQGKLLRNKKVIDILCAIYRERGDGIWIDIIDGRLDMFDASASAINLESEYSWNFEEDTYYSTLTWSRAALKSLQYLHQEFQIKFSTRPVIWGNNMLFPSKLDFAENSRLMLLQGDEQLQPLDAFAQEDFAGGYEWDGKGGHYWHDITHEQWIKNVNSLSFLAEQKLSARPIMLDGGVANRFFSAQSYDFRYKVSLFAYSSYLLAVKVESNGDIYTSLGVNVLQRECVSGADKTSVCLFDFYLWDLGTPQEKYKIGDPLIDESKIEGVYTRRFERGIVIVYPNYEDGPIDITLSAGLLDLKDNEIRNNITLQPNSATILLWDNI